MASHSISTEEVERVAKLARLSLSPEQVSRLRDDLSAILGYVGQLDEVDTSGVDATEHPVIPETPLREDVVTPGANRDEVLAQAPANREGGFAVPKVLEVEG